MLHGNYLAVLHPRTVLASDVGIANSYTDIRCRFNPCNPCIISDDNMRLFSRENEYLKKIETPGQPCRAFLSRRSCFGVPKRLIARLTNRTSATSSFLATFFLAGFLAAFLATFFAGFLATFFFATFFLATTRPPNSNRRLPCRPGLGPKYDWLIATETRQRTSSTSCPRCSEHRNKPSFVSYIDLKPFPT